jgi:ubiquinone biosynthesis protein
MINRYRTVPYEQIRFSQVLHDFINLLHRFDLRIPGTVYIIVKGVASLEKLGYNLDSEVSIGAYIRPYARQLIKKEYSIDSVTSKVMETASDYVHLIRTFPKDVSEILHTAKQGKLVHDIEITNQDFFNSTLSQLVRRIATVLIVGFIFVGSVIVQTWGSPTAFTGIMFVVSSLLALWLLIKLVLKAQT